MLKLRSLLPIKTVEPKYTNQVTVIHDEFKSVSDLLLKEAVNIIDKSRRSDRRNELRLANLGFTSAAGVKQALVLKDIVDSSKDTYNEILSWKKAYPLNKFISKKQIDVICSKYGLIFGPSSQFIGEIPEYNRKQLLNFKIRKEHLALYITEVDKELKYVFKDGSISVLPTRKVMIAGEILSTVEYGKLTEICISNVRRKAYGMKDINKSLMEYANPKKITSELLLGKTVPIASYYYKTSLFLGPRFMIVATPDLMDVSKSETFNKEVSSIKAIDKDPVIFAEVDRDKYVIVTAWGPEAKDPLILNEINN